MKYQDFKILDMIAHLEILAVKNNDPEVNLAAKMLHKELEIDPYPKEFIGCYGVKINGYFCPTCGRNIINGMKRCPNCGQKLRPIV